jgi:hypothetical protein
MHTQKALLPGVRPLLACLCLSLSAASLPADEDWIKDQNGCKIANPSPQPVETVTWSGACKEGFAEGQGLMQWYEDGKPGVRYDGSLARGAPSGQGKLTMPDGSTYEGGWLDGKQNGRGKLSAPGGLGYEGEWKNGVPDGHGVMRGASGDTLEGVWKGGRYVGPAPEQ